MKGNQEFTSRVNRMVDAMRGAGLDVLLLHSPAWRKDNVRYASNFSFLGHYAAVIIDRDGGATLLLSAYSDLERARREAWIDDIHVAGPNPVNAVVERLRRLGERLRVGVAGLENAGAGLIEGIRDRLPGVEIVSATKLYESLRLIKSPAEIASIRRVAQLVDLGFQAFLDNTVAGKKEYELIADVERVLKAAGAEDNFMLVASGGDEVRGMTPARNRAIERGQMLRTEVTPCYDGYYMQVCRNVVVGLPTPEQRRSFDIFYRAQEAALSALKPGLTGHDLARLQNGVFEAEGYGDYVSSKYTRTRGHGHGMYLDEQPTIEEGNDTVIQPGMIIIPHPNTFLPVAGYMVLGDPVLVTETGCEVLTKTERKLFYVD